MKNQTTKLNKSKLVARVMLLIFLITGVLSLVGCSMLAPGWSGQLQRIISYESHDQLLKFIERYNSKNDGFVSTFVSFDFENQDKITPYRYNLHTWVKYTTSLITGDLIINEWYDSAHPFGFAEELIFYVDDSNAQIICKYSTSTTQNYNFYENDEISLEYVGGYVKQHMWTEEMEGKYSIENDYREFDNAMDDVDSYYDYLYVYRIKVNGKDIVRIKITSKEEMTQEQLDEITKVLMKRFVIINTKG